MVANAQPEGQSNGLFGRMREQASQVGRRVRRGAGALTEQTAQTVGQVKRLLKDEAERYLDEKKGGAVEKIEKIGSVIHRAAHVLHAGKLDRVAEYVDMAAERADDASKYLEESEITEMVEDFADMVRRHPLAACSGLFIAGMAVARFAMASQQAAGDEAEAGEQWSDKRPNRESPARRGESRKRLKN